ncbi:MAG: GAF domain-containing protein [Rhodospirillaceae bacterium]|nr:GAF domain-containing protein [Rhodospirillaceae bacterium]
MFKFNGLHLSTRIIIAISMLVSVIFIVQSVYSIGKNDVARIKALDLRAQLTIATQAIALAGPLWDYDKERAKGNLRGMLEDPDIISVQVVDDAGEQFLSFNTGESIEREQPIEVSPFIEVSRDIEYINDDKKGRKVGTINVKFSTTTIAESFKADILNSIISGITILAVLIIGLTLAIRTFTLPITNMSALMRLRSEGDYTTKVNVKYIERNDEIGDIARSMEADQKNRQDEAKLLETTSAIASQLNLDSLLKQIMDASSDLLNAERSTLFLYDPEKNVLWSRIAQGIADMTIELQSGEGIAGIVFQTGQPEIIAAPYQDPRFNQEIDLKTGFETKNILCLPIKTKEGKSLGVTQVLNKINGEFTEHDIKRLTSLTAQASAAIENAQLFDNVLTMRNYNESILRSLTNGVVSLDKNKRIQKLNGAARRILGLKNQKVEGKQFSAILGPDNSWVIDTLDQVKKSGKPRQTMDNLLCLKKVDDVAVNLSAAPLFDLEDEPAGYLSVLEDISEEKRVRGTMSRYIPSRVVDQLLESGTDKLGGLSQKTTVLFSDIRKFTTISEKIGARATVKMLNEYFSGMVEMIDTHDGILDKYIGDAIMAIFGAPFTTDHDAENAVASAWKMLEFLEQLNQQRTTRGENAIEIGIGLNTGEVVLGNIGSARRMDYTVIGDAVNLAARLEGATKQYGAQLLISEFTWKEITTELQAGFRFVDLIRVKGKLEPVRIYEGVSNKPISQPQADLWQKALDHYYAQNWHAAETIFDSFMKKKPSGDPTAQLYIDRISIFKNSPPAKDWDGVWIMESK